MKEIQIGEKYGLLTIIKEVPQPENRKTKSKYYLCSCECGKEKIADRKGLISGGVKSCGCLRAQRVSQAVTIDITGQRFGKLLVLHKIDYRNTPDKSEAMWYCQCDCGNTTSVRGTSLREGATKSCGCLQRETASQLSAKNEVGNRYGRLLVIEKIGSTQKQNVIWKCLCDCGNYKEALGVDLRTGHVQSCGCLISAGEQKVAKYLQEHKIFYRSQFTCESLRSEKNGSYKFDFAILDKEGKPIGMIEYNGKQHYEQSDFFGKLEEIIERDKNKIEWCSKNKIPLLVIPYTYMDEKIYEAVQNFVEQITTIYDDGSIQMHARGEE